MNFLAEYFNDGRYLNLAEEKKQRGKSVIYDNNSSTNKNKKETIKELIESDWFTFSTKNICATMFSKCKLEIISDDVPTWETFFNNMRLYGENTSLRRLQDNLKGDMISYGSGYLEFVFDETTPTVLDLKRIDASRINNAKDRQGNLILDENGKSIGYVLSLGVNADTRNIGDQPPEIYRDIINLQKGDIFLNPIRIAEFKLYNRPNGIESIGLIEPSIQQTQRRMNLETAQVNAIWIRGTAPLFALVGDETHEPNQGMIQEAVDSLMDMKHSNATAFPYYMKPDSLSVKIDDLAGDIYNNLLSASASSAGIPLPFVTGQGEATNRACYSEDTKVLTEKGWKGYKSVGKNEKIANYDINTGNIKFYKHKGLYEYDYDGPMYHFNGKSEDILVTPEHRMFFSESRSNDWIIDEAQNIKYSRYKFKKNGVWDFNGNFISHIIIPKIIESGQGKHNELYSEDVKIDIHLFLEFLGYFLSEGGISHKGKSYTITFAQKGEYEEDFRKCFNKMPFPFTEYYDDKDEIWRWSVSDKRLWKYMKNFGNYCYDKHLNGFTNIDKKSMKILFESMMKGEGHWDRKYDKGYYATTSEKMAEDFITLSMKLGYSANYQKQKDFNLKKDYHYNLYRVNLIKDRYELTHNKDYDKIIAYDGKVWCFETETGFFLTMRNGKVAIQGNTLKTQREMFEDNIQEKIRNFDEDWNLLVMDRISQLNGYASAKIKSSNIRLESRDEFAKRLKTYYDMEAFSPKEIRMNIKNNDDLQFDDVDYEKYISEKEKERKSLIEKNSEKEESNTTEKKDSDNEKE
jgi:hypothetical protein